ncbi:MAG: DUF4038 domain-containing protein [Limisphaerales bacterium]
MPQPRTPVVLIIMRTFAKLSTLLCLIVPSQWLLMAETKATTQANEEVEWSLISAKDYGDAFNDVELDFMVTTPGNQRLRVPAFWAGGRTWRGRYSSATLGVHRFRTECSDAGNAGLHGVEGQVEVVAYRGDNPLLVHGGLRVAADHRHFAYADGTPFLWLGDTWWMGLCARLKWPDDFQTLAADRKQKGFNVIQIVAGLYPDMPAFDERGANEAGFPWEKDYSRIRPEYFDAADRRISHLVREGFVPCVVGAWGYHLPWLGVDKMKKHWRYLIARWGALPVVWCAAGEGTMPFYLSKNPAAESAMQKREWTEVIRSIHATDPFHRLVTIHPPSRARDAVTDPRVLDFDMHQSGHGAPAFRHGALALGAYRSEPIMPVISGEARYEALDLGRKLDAADSRQAFWAHLINGGCAGHTYGANGIWQVNRRDQPYGPSPGGNNWGTIPWDEAMRLPGSSQLAAAKRLLESLPWYKLEPHPEWIEWATPIDTPLSFAGAQWIWFPEGDPRADAPVAKRFFRRGFELSADKRIASARLRVRGDDRCAVWLNGEPLGEQADWQTGREFAGVERKLRAGQNTLAVEAENLPAPVAKNPAGLLFRLDVRFTDDTTMHVDSDGECQAAKTAAAGWQHGDFDAHDWTAAKLLGAYGCAPWGLITAQTQIDPPLCAAAADELRLAYLLEPRAVRVSALKPGMRYSFQWFNPVDGVRRPAFRLTADAQGKAVVAPPAEDAHDWTLLVTP